jgi:hypothetical protein
MIKLIYANAETSMQSGEQIGAHSVRNVTGASNVRRLTSGETKPPGLDEPCNPSVTGSLGRSIPGTRSGQRDSLFRRMSSLFGQKKFPVSGGAGNWPQAVESAWRPAPKTAQKDQNRAKFPKIPC